MSTALHLQPSGAQWHPAPPSHTQRCLAVRRVFSEYRIIMPIAQSRLRISHHFLCTKCPHFFCPLYFLCTKCPRFLCPLYFLCTKCPHFMGITKQKVGRRPTFQRVKYSNLYIKYAVLWLCPFVWGFSLQPLN